MIPAKPVMVIASLGEPRNPKTWSGTPRNIINALEKLGVKTLSLDLGLKKYQKAGYWLAGRLSGWGRYYYMGRRARAHITEIFHHKIKHLERTKILHICGGTVTVPLSKIDSEVEQYLVCDTTWHLWSKWAIDMHQLSSLNIEIAEQLEREAYAQIKHFFPTSEYVRQDLIDRYGVDPKRITVIGTGRGSIQPFTGDKDYKNGHILFVAKLRFEDKGGRLLLEGFKLAQKKNPSLKLIIVGQDRYKKIIGAIPNVSVIGYISWEELQQLFYTAALFAMPAFNEPWGLVYLEALACKIPILGLNRNSLPEITQYGKYGFLVDDPTPERIADAILHAFSDPGRLREMGLAGQKYCLDTFSWDRVATKIASVMLGESETTAELKGSKNAGK